MLCLPAPLAALAAYPQFLVYKLVPRPGGKMDKIPCDPRTLKPCDAHDPARWVLAVDACATASLLGAGWGVSFVLTEQDPFFCLDLDGCREGDKWNGTAAMALASFPGAAVEVSSSGNGLHIFGRYAAAIEHGCKNLALGAELYTRRKPIALTGTNAVGDAGVDFTPQLVSFAAEFFPAKRAEAVALPEHEGPVPEWRGPSDDGELLRRALMSKSASAVFGTRARFADLWTRNVEVLAQVFPAAGLDREFDESSADAALAAHLAFWTGKDRERMHRLMCQSGLYREKYEREDYLPRTIEGVVSRPGDVLQDKPKELPVARGTSEPVLATTPAPRLVQGSTFLDPQAQFELFKGCVYVQDRHRVLVPGGALLKPEQFRAAYGGYTFMMDTNNEKTTRNAWEAFTESQAIRPPKADSVCFRPELPPAAIVDEAGRTLANTYWPASVPRAKGNPEPFLRHIRLLLPNERDQALLLNYMAACVQYQGRKFSWCPVLQGVEGNGKSFLSVCVAQAVGQHYVEWPHARDLKEKFNGWIAGKVFIGLEELYSEEHRADILENLKTLITGGFGIQIQHKGVDQYSASICANFMATTNYKTAIRKNADNARRFAVFFTAQQTVDDMKRCGMTGDYFKHLWDWAREEGFAIVSEMLYTMKIAEEYNPATTLHRAPATSSTDAVIEEARGSVEQYIAEAIAQDTPGFCGGWVSSVALDRLVQETLRLGNKLPPSRRREILKSMGYLLHPGLKEGRVNNPVMPDNRKAQLYIHQDHPARWAEGPSEIARLYTAAQTQ